MKKLLLLLLLIPLISCTEDWTGEKEVTYLQDRNGIKYEVNSEVGFTGKYVLYDNSGQKLYETNYKNDNNVGLHTWWDKEGNVTKTKTYKDGELVK